MDEKRRELLQKAGFSDDFIENELAAPEDRLDIVTQTSDLDRIRRQRLWFDRGILDEVRRKSDAENNREKAVEKLNRHNTSFWRRLFKSREKIVDEIKFEQFIIQDAVKVLKYWNDKLQELQKICNHPKSKMDAYDHAHRSIGYYSCHYCGWVAMHRPAK